MSFDEKNCRKAVNFDLDTNALKSSFTPSQTLEKGIYAQGGL